MHSNWWLTTLSYLEMGAIFGVIFFLVKRRLVASWPSLFLFLSVELTRNIYLMGSIAMHGKYRYYFYVYWIGAAVLATLQLSIIADIIRAFPGLKFPHRDLLIFIGIAGVTMAVCSFWYCFHSPAGLSQWRNWRDFATLLNHCVYVSWAGFSIALLGSSRVLNIGWAPLAARIASGVFFRLVTSLIASQFYASRTPNIRLIGNAIDSLCSLCVFVFWIWLLISPPPLYDDDLLGEVDSHEDPMFSRLLLLSPSSRER